MWGAGGVPVYLSLARGHISTRSDHLLGPGHNRCDVNTINFSILQLKK